ncbi:MAG: NUDIX domain-containing protein [Verrucomicrobia bacterium]|nr:NUDIX domain-containing protein [Verrucomicrobiota bacterium]
MDLFIANVECAIEHDGKYLIIRRPAGVHAAGLLAFPGGKVEYKDGRENAQVLFEAAKREVLEEVGLRLLDPLHYVSSRYFIAPPDNHVLDTILYCKLERTIVQVIPSPKEVPAYFWLTSEEIQQHPAAPPWLKKDLLDIESMLSSFSF